MIIITTIGIQLLLNHSCRQIRWEQHQIDHLMILTLHNWHQVEYNQLMWFWQIDAKIDNFAVSRPCVGWWYFDFFCCDVFRDESYASCFLSGSKRCICDEDTEIDFVTLCFLKLKVQKLSRRGTENNERFGTSCWEYTGLYWWYCN